MLSIIDANAEVFDAFLIVAVILFIIGAVYSVSRNAFEQTIGFIGWAALAFALLFLT